MDGPLRRAECIFRGALARLKGWASTRPSIRSRPTCERAGVSNACHEDSHGIEQPQLSPFVSARLPAGLVALRRNGITPRRVALALLKAIHFLGLAAVLAVTRPRRGCYDNHRQQNQQCSNCRHSHRIVPSAKGAPSPCVPAYFQLAAGPYPRLNVPFSTQSIAPEG